MTTVKSNTALAPRDKQPSQDHSEIIRAWTPICLAAVGGVIAFSVVLVTAFSSGKINEAQWASAMGLAGTAIGAGAGIAQANNTKITAKDSEGREVEAETGGNG